MITAIIRNKENTLVLELPHSIYDIYEKLQSIGIMLNMLLNLQYRCFSAGESISDTEKQEEEK